MILLDKKILEVCDEQYKLRDSIDEERHFKSKQEVLNDCIWARRGESIKNATNTTTKYRDVLENL